MKKIFLISCAIVTSISAANQPQKGIAKVQEAKIDYSFYAQCVQPNIDSLKKKFNENKPAIEKFSQTSEFSFARTCIGLALLTAPYRWTQVAAGLYLVAPVTKQVYNDLLKRK